MLGTFITYKTSPAGRLSWMAVALAVVIVAGYFSLGRGIEWDTPAAIASVGNQGERDASGELGKEVAEDGEELPWVPFSMEKLTELTAAGKPVLLDITARWCPNCKYNSAFVFNTAEVKAAVEKYGIVPMLADWTARGPVIGQLIDKLAPGGSIPLAAVFPAGRPDEPVVMLGIVTQQQVIDALAEASVASGGV
jgi:thiol:disulfide interchange protein